MMVRDVKYMDVDDFRDNTGHTFVKIVDFGQANVVSLQSQELFQQQYRKSVVEGGMGMSADEFTVLGTGWCTMTCRDRGTPVYRPPEMIPYDAATERFVARESRPYSIKADIYSAVMIVWECWTRCRPFSEGKFARLHPIMLDKAVVTGQRPIIPDDCPPLLHALIARGWCASPDLRPSATSVFQILSRDEVREDRSRSSLLFPLDGFVKGLSDPTVVLKTVSHYAWDFLLEECRTPILTTLEDYRISLDDRVGKQLSVRRRVRDSLKKRMQEVLCHGVRHEITHVAAMKLPVLAFGLLTAGPLESAAAVELIDCRRIRGFEDHNFSTVTLMQQLVIAMCDRGGARGRGNWLCCARRCRPRPMRHQIAR